MKVIFWGLVVMDSLVVLFSCFCMAAFLFVEKVQKKFLPDEDVDSVRSGFRLRAYQSMMTALILAFVCIAFDGLLL